MRTNFELSVAFILPVCPYVKHKSSNCNRPQAQISEVTLQGRENVVKLRWHTSEEYQKLSKKQRRILWKWQKTKEGKKARDDHNKQVQAKKAAQAKKLEARVSSLEQGAPILNLLSEIPLLQGCMSPCT